VEAETRAVLEGLVGDAIRRCRALRDEARSEDRMGSTEWEARRRTELTAQMERYERALASLRELLEKSPAPRWIPVGEEEPQDGRWLVGWFAPAGFGKGLEWCSQTARRLDGAWLPHYKPTHWRPLPPPPRGG